MVDKHYRETLPLKIWPMRSCSEKIGRLWVPHGFDLGAIYPFQHEGHEDLRMRRTCMTSAYPDHCPVRPEMSLLAQLAPCRTMKPAAPPEMLLLSLEASQLTRMAVPATASPDTLPHRSTIPGRRQLSSARTLPPLSHTAPARINTMPSRRRTECTAAVQGRARHPCSRTRSALTELGGLVVHPEARGPGVGNFVAARLMGPCTAPPFSRG